MVSPTGESARLFVRRVAPQAVTWRIQAAESAGSTGVPSGVQRDPIGGRENGENWTRILGLVSFLLVVETDVAVEKALLLCAEGAAVWARIDGGMGMFWMMCSVVVGFGGIWGMNGCCVLSQVAPQSDDGLRRRGDAVAVGKKDPLGTSRETGKGHASCRPGLYDA